MRGPVRARSTGRLFGNAGCEHIVEERAEVREPEAATEPTRRRIEFAMRMEFQQRVAALDVYPAAVVPGFSEPRFFVEAEGGFEAARWQAGGRNVGQRGFFEWRCDESNRQHGLPWRLSRLRKAEAEILAARAPWRRARRHIERCRHFLREKFLPAQVSDVACGKRGEIAIEHRGYRVAPVEPEIAPQMIGAQAGVRDDRRETAGVVAVDGGIRVVHQPCVQRRDERSVGGWQ